VPPVGTEHPANSPKNTGVQLEGGAKSGALFGKTASDQGAEGEGIDQGDALAKLAATLLTLSPADRARLAAMLTGKGV
jgi:hypothetical protein